MSAFFSDGVTCPACKSSLPWFNMCRGPGTNYQILPYCPICGFLLLPGIIPPKNLDRRKPFQLSLFDGAL